MSIRVDIEKRLGDFTLKTAFEAGDEVLALLGASGSGKSMTLRCVAGIVKPDRGHIEVDGVTLFDSERHIDLTPQQRRTGLMFQNYALFPNMTVRQNILAGARREGKHDIAQAQALMERFGLAPLAGRYPSQISGGQQQRTALARMLVSGPRVLLLDEPFSALDSHLRFRLERDMQQVMREFGKSVLLVSHDRDEVFRLADSIVIIENGRVEAAGAKHAIFRDPKTVAGARLTGCKFISRAEKRDGRRIYASDWGVELALDRDPGKIAAVGMRMHSVRFGDGENAVRCAVAGVIENPFDYTILLRPAGRPDATAFGWTAGKDEWAALQGAQELTVHMPAAELLLLKGEEDANGNGL